MIGLALIALFPVAFIVLGICCAVSNWRNGIDVGSER